jgi:septal ring factor EnvC (AmiA/AmiB activator)
MMTTKLRRAFVTSAVATILAGCSSNPPCQTDLAAVEAARQAAVAAEAKLAEAERTKQQLEEEIAAEQARKAELEQRKAELEAQIAEMSK